MEGNNSTAIRVGSVLVVVATVMMVALLILLISAPWFFRARYVGGLLGMLLLASLPVSAFGGIVLLAKTKQSRWVFPPLLALIAFALLMIFARALSVAGMH
ncbi:MAG: hypothetical protein DWB45_05810 [Xanthomonadales bacterium]|nr:hypothetical protein [Xanthomonadales bacterium]MDL1869518.1 hypothetical protein [Gammaproteobacteria bacterium PRO6]